MKKFFFLTFAIWHMLYSMERNELNLTEKAPQQIPTKNIRRGGTYRCKTCSFTCDSVKEISDHLFLKHDIREIFACKKCFETFNSEGSANLHCKQCTVFKCKLCSEVIFGQVTDQIEHNKTAHNITMREDELSHRTLKDELVAFMPKQKKPKRYDPYKVSLQRVDEQPDRVIENEQKKICAQCHGYFYKRYLVRHAEVCKGANNKICEYCKQQFERPCDRSRHEKKCYSNPNRSFKEPISAQISVASEQVACTNCHKVFADYSDLMTHITNCIMFLCPYCNERLKFGSYLSHHCKNNQ